MSEFKKYRRSAIAEMADWHPGFDMDRVSVSVADRENGSPKLGDKIARNPKDHGDKWLVAAAYFADYFEPVDKPVADDALEAMQAANRARLDSWSTEPSEPATDKDHLTVEPVADDALPEPVAWGLSSEYMPGCVLSATTHREASTWSGWVPLYTADQMRAAIARERESMNELRRAVAELVGEDQETWPDHGNAPLAIGATVASLHAWCERAEAEISTLRQQLADAVRDAERYRWLRKMLNGDGFSQKDALLAACQDDMDAAIDAAIAAGAQK